MKDRFNQWLSQHAQVAGVQACALRYPDQTSFTEVRASNFSRDALENAWRCVADTFQVLKHYRVPAADLRWTFEHSLLYCLNRPDGVYLLAFTTRKAAELDAPGLQRLFVEFQEFAPG
jgi:hypothetical protein